MDYSVLIPHKVVICKFWSRCDMRSIHLLENWRFTYSRTQEYGERVLLIFNSRFLWVSGTLPKYVVDVLQYRVQNSYLAVQMHSCYPALKTPPTIRINPAPVSVCDTTYRTQLIAQNTGVIRTSQ